MRDDLSIPASNGARMPAMEPSYRAPRPRSGVDSNTRRLALVAGGIGGSLLLLVGLWSFSGRHHAGVPVIEADSRPIRVRPTNAGGMQVAGQNESIMSGDGPATAAALAPAAEAPAPQALKAQEQAKPSQTQATPTQLAPSQLAQAQPAQSQPALVQPAPRLAAPQIVALAPPSALPTPTQRVSLRAGADVPAMAAPTKPKVAEAHPPEATHVAETGHMQVQLAALTSEQGATLEWDRLSHKLPDLLGGRRPQVLRFERDGQVFWRLRTGGFADREQASRFCEQVKAKGAGCAVSAS